MRRLLLLILVASSMFAEPRRRCVRPPGTFTTFHLEEAGALLAAPDGAMWSLGKHVGRITADGRFSLIAWDANCSSRAAFLRPDTLVCASYTGNRALRMVDTRGRVTDLPVDSNYISAMTASPDGTVLLTGKDGLSRISAEGSVTIIDLPSTIHSPGAITVGIDGAIWFTAGRTLVRMLSDGTYQEFHGDDSLFERRRPSAGFTDIVGGADGTIWLAITTESRTSGYSRGGAIIAFTPDGSFHEVLAVSFAFYLTPVPDGSLWFIDGIAPGYVCGIPELVHLTPGAGARKYQLPYGFPPVYVRGLAVDATGRVWVTLTDPVAGPQLGILR